MKKLALVLLTVIAVCTFSACGKETSNSKTEEADFIDGDIVAEIDETTESFYYLEHLYSSSFLKLSTEEIYDSKVVLSKYSFVEYPGLIKNDKDIENYNDFVQIFAHAKNADGINVYYSEREYIYMCESNISKDNKTPSYHKSTAVLTSEDYDALRRIKAGRYDYGTLAGLFEEGVTKPYGLSYLDSPYSSTINMTQIKYGCLSQVEELLDGYKCDLHYGQLKYVGKIDKNPYGFDDYVTFAINTSVNEKYDIVTIFAYKEGEYLYAYNYDRGFKFQDYYRSERKLTNIDYVLLESYISHP